MSYRKILSGTTKLEAVIVSQNYLHYPHLVTKLQRYLAVQLGNLGLDQVPDLVQPLLALRLETHDQHGLGVTGPDHRAGRSLFWNFSRILPKEGKPFFHRNPADS